MSNQHHVYNLEANYYSNVYNVHLKLASSTEYKESFLIDLNGPRRYRSN